MESQIVAAIIADAALKRSNEQWEDGGQWEDQWPDGGEYADYAVPPEPSDDDE